MLGKDSSIGITLTLFSSSSSCIVKGDQEDAGLKDMLKMARCASDVAFTTHTKLIDLGIMLAKKCKKLDHLEYKFFT